MAARVEVVEVEVEVLVGGLACVQRWEAL